MNAETIAARVEARKLAGLLLEMAGQESFDSDDARQTFWACVRDEALKHAQLPAPPTPKRLEPMTDAQARQFDLVPMPWGKYEGQSVCEVYDIDPGYLDYLLEPDQFKVDLARYLLAVNRVPDLDDDTIPY